MILAKLAAGDTIPKHTDAGFSLLHCHRVHLPIITNDNVVFSVGGEDGDAANEAMIGAIFERARQQLEDQNQATDKR